MKPLYYILYRFYKLAGLLPAPDNRKYSRPGLWLAAVIFFNVDTIVTVQGISRPQLSIYTSIGCFLAWAILWWWIYSRPVITNRMVALEASESRTASIVGNLLTAAYLIFSIALWTGTK
ncbi:hypothetical protein EYV94_12085 [Puteibacter caeruleilacunae]|nr:hypothetical protein EYV94_12085 [Puteibacter caeruleilacunae]